jgi:hypothetical protein
MKRSKKSYSLFWTKLGKTELEVLIVFGKVLLLLVEFAYCYPSALSLERLVKGITSR